MPYFVFAPWLQRLWWWCTITAAVTFGSKLVPPWCKVDALHSWKSLMQPEKQSKNKYLTKLIICPLGKGWKTSKKLCSCGHHHSDQMWARAQVCEVILSFSEGSDFDLAQVIYWSAKIGLRGHRKVVFSQLISRKGAFFIRFCARFSNLSFHNKKKVLTLSFKWNFCWYIELWSMCIKILQRLFTFYECSWMLSSNTLVRRWEGYWMKVDFPWEETEERIVSLFVFLVM